MSKCPIPDSFVVVGHILLEMGIRRYEPKVVQSLHNSMQGHVIKLIKEAQKFSISSGKSIIDLDDMHLTLKCSYEEMNMLPKRETLLEIAESRKSIPLPSDDQMDAVKLPKPKKAKPNWYINF